MSPILTYGEPAILAAVRNVPFGVQQHLAREADNALVRRTTCCWRQVGRGGSRDVQADHGEIAIIKFPNVRTPIAAHAFRAVGMGSLCALGLGMSFFLPWAHFFGAQPSGFDLQKLGDEQRLLWFIPIFCAITIVAGVTKRNQSIAGQLTSVLPPYWFLYSQL